MKILYVIHQFYPNFYSGTERVSLNIAEMVQKMGNIVKFVTYSPEHNICGGENFGNVVYKDYMVGKIPVTEFYTQNESILFNVNIVNDELYDFARMILEKEKPDVVHIMHPMRVGVFIKAAQDAGIKTVITITDLMYICSRVVMNNERNELCCSAKHGKACDVDCPGTGKQHTQRFEQVEKLLHGADFITAPSAFISHIVKSEMPDVFVSVVKHGVDMKTFRNTKVYSKDSKLVFAFVGTIQEHKGLHIFIDNASKVESKHVAFKIYGDYDNDYGRKLAKSVKNDKRFTFEGSFPKECATQVYSGIDVLVIPSQCYESYSMVKHEAISAGVPVIVSDLGALSEEIQNKKNGFKFDITKKNSLYEIMSEIIEEPSILNGVRNEMKKYFVPIVEQEAFRYCDIYKNLFSQR